MSTKDIFMFDARDIHTNYPVMHFGKQKEKNPHKVEKAKKAKRRAQKQGRRKSR